MRWEGRGGTVSQKKARPWRMHASSATICHREGLTGTAWRGKQKRRPSLECRDAQFDRRQVLTAMNRRAFLKAGTLAAIGTIAGSGAAFAADTEIEISPASPGRSSARTSMGTSSSTSAASSTTACG